MADRPDWPEPGAHSGMAMTPPVTGWGDRAPRDGFSEGSPAPMSSPIEPARHQRDGAAHEADRPLPTDEGERASAPLGPGDPAALQQGCRCPTLANRPEAGDSLNALVAPDCPMHHPAPSGEAPHHASALGPPPGAPGQLLPPTDRADGVRPDEP